MTPEEAYLTGSLPAPVALMRLLLEGCPAEAAITRLATAAESQPALLPLLTLAREHRDGLSSLERMVRAGAMHAAQPDAASAIAESRAMFDRLVRINPEASVAAYSLGDPALLAAATGELVEWLRAQGLLARRPDILDLGCGIGRLAAALAPEAGSVIGLDVSAEMISEARRRHPGLRFETCSGSDLAGIATASCDLVIAADVFPYLVQGGLDLAAHMIAEAARVLRPGGDLLMLNFSYRGAAIDQRDLPAIAAASGLELLHNGTRAFLLWDGAIFWMRRAPQR